MNSYKKYYKKVICNRYFFYGGNMQIIKKKNNGLKQANYNPRKNLRLVDKSIKNGYIELVIYNKQHD